MKYRDKWPSYAKQWDSMKIDPKRRHEFDQTARFLLKPASKVQYKELEASTGVPWAMIAIIAMRESGGRFDRSLAQGDPWNKRSVHRPAGRGPFKSWQAAGYDALVTLKHWDKIIDWRLEKVIYYWEAYNGWGYAMHGVPSAYVWSGCNVYKSGKYIFDGSKGWRANVVDVQLGCAPLLKVIMELDSTVTFARED